MNNDELKEEIEHYNGTDFVTKNKVLQENSGRNAVIAVKPEGNERETHTKNMERYFSMANNNMKSFLALIGRHIGLRLNLYNTVLFCAEKQRRSLCMLYAQHPNYGDKRTLK
jgi:hypothetical protein